MGVLQWLGPKLVSCPFLSLSRYFLILHNSFFSFIGVGVTLEVITLLSPGRVIGIIVMEKGM
jgi:hypothetical protein